MEFENDTNLKKNHTLLTGSLAEIGERRIDHPGLHTIRELSQEITILSHAVAVLSWDQETYMPESAVEERAEQQAAISTMIHRKLTGNEMAQALESVGASAAHPFGTIDTDWQSQRVIRAVWRSHARAIKLTGDFVRDMTLASSLGQAHWAKARQAGDYGIFKPYLKRIIDLKRQEAELVGYATEPYDALLDEYEPSVPASDIDRVFVELRKELVPLVKAISLAKQPDVTLLDKAYPAALQQEFGRLVLGHMGYDMKRGRLDTSAHPFTTTLGRHDVRITSRYDERNFAPGIFSIIHEGGHGIYELGFAEDLDPVLCNGTSLGIHESQSRTWENIVGRSREFWQYFFPRLKERFPSQLEGYSSEDLYRAINKVEPSFIRVDADEVTYSLHIMLRFNIELGIMRGNLSVDELPEAWREESKLLLGITPPDDRMGVLQDVHWSFGAIGYFPTYALGNLYGAMFFEKAEKDIPGLKSLIAQGKLDPLREWSGRNIHRYGAAKTPAELIQDITGKSLDHRPFVAYLTAKYKELYRL